jgi:hypothetical protein
MIHKRCKNVFLKEHGIFIVFVSLLFLYSSEHSFYILCPTLWSVAQKNLKSLPLSIMFVHPWSIQCSVYWKDDSSVGYGLEWSENMKTLSGQFVSQSRFKPRIFWTWVYSVTSRWTTSVCPQVAFSKRGMYELWHSHLWIIQYIGQSRIFFPSVRAPPRISHGQKSCWLLARQPTLTQFSCCKWRTNLSSSSVRVDFLSSFRPQTSSHLLLGLPRSSLPNGWQCKSFLGAFSDCILCGYSCQI